MKINNISIMSHNALDLELNEVKPITIFRGKHSSLVLDLMREVIGDNNPVCDPDSVDDGHFIIHTDIDMDGKNYSACYIRSADFPGDNRIAVNFKPNSIEYSEDDTIEFTKKCKEINAEKRPIFIYPSELGGNNNVTAFIQALSSADRQVFLAVPEERPVINHENIRDISVG